VNNSLCLLLTVELTVGLIFYTEPAVLRGIPFDDPATLDVELIPKALAPR
jgi:hypothetical protein